MTNRQHSRGIVIIGAGLLQIPIIETAKRMNYQTFVVDINTKAIGANLGDQFIEASTRDPKLVIKKLEPYAGQFHMCLTVGTDMTNTTSAVNEYFGLPGITKSQSAVTSHKGNMRRFLAESGFEQPYFVVSTNKEKLYSWAGEHSNEFADGFVIKPVQNMGARGVLYLPDIHHLSYAFEMAQSNSLNGEVILEEFIPAHEISIDALAFNNEVVITGFADRIIEMKDNRFFIERGHTMPSRLESNIELEITTNLKKLLETNIFRNYTGAFKGDIRLTKDNKIIIGEIATRLSGGFMSTHTYPYASTIDLMQAYVDLHESRLDLRQFLNQYQKVSIERSIEAPAGILVAIEKVDLIDYQTQNASLKDVFYNYKIGDIVQDLQSNVGKLAHFVIEASSLQEAEQLWVTIQDNFQFSIKPLEYNNLELNRTARKRFNPKSCWVCKVCDGNNCASGVPGMGGVGLMQGFKENIKALNELKIIPEFLDEKERLDFEVSTSYELFSMKASAPILSAPITGSKTNMANSITEFDYAFETAAALKDLDLIPTFGDGATEDKYRIGLYAISQFGRGLPVFKPRKNLNLLAKRIELSEKMGAAAWGIDIDGVSFKTMTLKNQATSRKSCTDLEFLRSCSNLPFFLKGILSIHDARLACESGASAIIVSNHGGRVIDAAPGTAQVLPEIAEFVKKRYPKVQVLVDGGIRSGYDVFKMLALGADAVLIGRPVVISAVGFKRLGVRNLMELYISELRKTMQILSISNLEEIDSKYIRRFN